MILDDIRGNREVIVRLKARASFMRGAYLFSGPEGIGKFCAALGVAKAASCPQGGCSRCRWCIDIDRGSNPDVHVIDNGYSGEVKIEDIRLLQAQAALRPYQSDVSVFIINDAHTMNTVAANALLKTLEEPADYALFVLVTDKPQLVLKTVLSRCRVEKFAPLSRAEFSETIRSCGVDAATSRYLAYFCEGALGRALRMKGADTIGAKNRIIDEFMSGRFQIRDTYKKDELREQMSVLAAWFRDVYLAKLGVDDPVNADRRQALEAACGRFSLDGIEEIFAFISSSFLYCEQNVNPKLLAANLHACIEAAGERPA